MENKGDLYSEEVKWEAKLKRKYFSSYLYPFDSVFLNE